MLKGIVFDMDGTLTLTEQLHYEAYRRVFAQQGITYTWEEERTSFASAGGRYTFTTLFAQHGVHGDIDACIEEKERVYIDLLLHTTLELVPGVIPFLEGLEQRGIRKIIASTTRQDIILLTLERAGLTKFFSEFVSGNDVAHQKPAPDIFLKALEKIQCAPQEAIVFEDAINGVKAACAAKIPCIALATTTSKDALMAAGARNVVTDYNELTDDIFNLT